MINLIIRNFWSRFFYFCLFCFVYVCVVVFIFVLSFRNSLISLLPKNIKIVKIYVSNEKITRTTLTYFLGEISFNSFDVYHTNMNWKVTLNYWNIQTGRSGLFIPVIKCSPHAFCLVLVASFKRLRSLYKFQVS